MKKYKKNFDYSYALGTELTLELLLRHPEKVINVYIHSKQNANEIYYRIKNLCLKHKIKIIYSDKIFKIVSDKENCYIIGAFKKYESKIVFENNHLVLVNPSNRGNLGTIIRTSIGFGINDIAIIKPAVDIFDPKTIRASMGALFRVNFQYFDSFEQYLQSIEERDIFTFMLDGAEQLDKIKIPEKYSLVFGNEASGLPSEFQNYGQSILIKHLNTIDSLNLCNAVSIALYQFTKGRV
ncbi:MAG: TrmH family RNA methyltransferase [Bacillota bacterium]|jgi:TrmH family RNA methyltransferase|nr:TrmH family RNA methyltransferase [Bacillota bacterium]NLL27102.1 TrmH family RNA methyltransferase [Erysipelotrichia bacterium]